MVVSIGHFDTDQDEFVIEGRLHNGAAVPGSSDDWEQWVTQFRGAPHDIDREYHRIEHQSQLDRQIIDRPAAHPTRRIFADDENEDAIPNGVDSSPDK